MKRSHHSLVKTAGIGDLIRRGKRRQERPHGPAEAGRFYKDMNKDIVVSARGQRAAAKGAALPLEAGRENVSSLEDSRYERSRPSTKNASLPFLLSVPLPFEDAS
jgi:hypothetical protein